MSDSEDLRLIIEALMSRPSSKNTRHSSILLIGFMGSGKSSIGRRVARRLHCDFLDLDKEIEAEAGCKIPQIFLREGEEKFRQRETNLLRKIIKKEAVIASGGGLVTRPENRALLLQAAARGTNIVYLQADPHTLAERIRRQPGKRPLIDGPGRPLDFEATKQRVEELLAARRAFYEECATQVVSTDGREFEEVVDEIVRGIESGIQQK